MPSRTMPGGARAVIHARPLAAGLLPALLAVLLLPLQASAAPNGYGVITEYATSPNSGPAGIITGPDGKIWYAGASTDTVVQVDPATGATLRSVSTLLGGSAGCMPTGLTIGPDHNLWTSCFTGDYLVRITTAGAATQYLLPTGSAPWALTPGPDGALWFTEEGTGKIGRLDMTSFVLSEFPLPAGAGAKPRGIAAGSDGRLWFTEQGTNLIGWINTGGLVHEYATPTPNSSPFDIALGPHDHLYYTENTTNRIGKIAMDGTQTEFLVPTVSNLPHMINVGPDGNLWFTYFGLGNKIGSMTPGGTFQDFSVPTALSHPFGITTGPDGNVWFTEGGGFKIAKIGARHNVLVLDRTGIGFGDVAAGAVARAQRVTMTNTGPDPVPAFTPIVTAGYGSGSGKFFFSAETCSVGPIASGSSCYADIEFKSVGLPGAATGTLLFDTSPGASDEQRLTASLEANDVGAACTSTAISADLASPQNVGATVTLSATSVGCPNVSPLYRFWVRDASAVWQMVQDFSTATSFAWNTSTWGQGTFLIGVWVKDAGSTNTYDAYAFGTFTLSVPTCSSTNLSSDIASPQVVGPTVNFTASSLGCPSPLYQWWVRDTDGNWAIVPGHDFAHSSTTFAWNTGALVEGTYQVGVWAKQQLSANSYDAFAFVTYTLTITHCTAVNLGTSMISPQGAGATITLTTTVTGCASPQYRFYVRDSSAVWHIVQDFGALSTYSWDPSSPVSTNNAGTYLLGVWARQIGSANAYDAFAFITFSLTSGPTCTVDIAADKTSPQPLLTTVTWTATASCANPVQYQFWVNRPGGTWTIVEPFSSTSTLAWTGQDRGSLQVGVWVLQSGSTTAYDAFAFNTFTFVVPSPAQVCSSAGVTSDVPSPQLVGGTVNFTASATGCSSPQYQWWVRDTSANWAVVTDFAHSSATLAWNTSGLLPGTYLVGVWARQINSSAGYEAYSFITYTLTLPAGQVCSSVGISSNVPSPQPRGANVVFLAAAAGCNTPEYRYFLAPPGRPFSEYQPYGAYNQMIWITNALVPGPYQIGVWARQQGSTAPYEAFAIVTFQIQPAGTPCSSLALFPTNGSSVNDITSQPPQPVGTKITWTASAGGCASAEYAFFFTTFFYGADYFLVRDYASTPTYTWTTAGWPRGTYGIQVFARLAGSSTYLDLIAVATFEVV